MLCAVKGTILTIPSFQEVQGLSALETSIRILPALVTAVIINISVGYFVNRLPIMLVVLTTAAIASLSPLFMALINPEWPYWYMAFSAQVGESHGLAVQYMNM
jgi:hypothetical protein